MRKTEVRGQRSEGRGQRQKAGDRSQKSEVRGQETEVRRGLEGWRVSKKSRSEGFEGSSEKCNSW